MIGIHPAHTQPSDTPPVGKDVMNAGRLSDRIVSPPMESWVIFKAVTGISRRFPNREERWEIFTILGLDFDLNQFREWILSGDFREIVERFSTREERKEICTILELEHEVKRMETWVTLRAMAEMKNRFPNRTERQDLFEILGMDTDIKEFREPEFRGHFSFNRSVRGTVLCPQEDNCDICRF